jgi:hypothetical protein
MTGIKKLLLSILTLSIFAVNVFARGQISVFNGGLVGMVPSQIGSVGGVIVGGY